MAKRRGAHKGEEVVREVGEHPWGFQGGGNGQRSGTEVGLLDLAVRKSLVTWARAVLAESWGESPSATASVQVRKKADEGGKEGCNWRGWRWR